MGENLRSLDDSVVEGTTNLDERLVEASKKLVEASRHRTG